MTEFLKQSTAVTKKMGPFLDDSDGKSEETGLTIAQANIRLSKNGGNIAQSNNVAGATHDELGYYGVPLDTTDTATLGSLRVIIHISGALPVWNDYMVVPENVWDSLFGSDKLQVHAVEITNSLITAASIATDAIGSDELADSAVTKIFAYVAEGALTFIQMFRVAYAVLSGKSSGGGTTTIVFRDVADAKDRVSTTVDSSGNRTAISNDGA